MEYKVQDAMDSFISRCLKNWAAHQAPPADGKERLLQAAQLPLPPVKHFIGRIWLDRIFSTQVPQRMFEDDVLTIPFTQSRILSFHLTTSIRFVA
jgi:hypothetical protein